jgi:hypothetical protein
VNVALAHLDTADQSESVFAAVRATAADTDEDRADMAADETLTRRALELLASKRNDAYEVALADLREDTQAWWARVLARDPDELEEDEQPATADVEGLRRFLEGEVLAWLENRRKELANRPLIREQAFGEALDRHTRCIPRARDPFAPNCANPRRRASKGAKPHKILELLPY